MESKAKLFGHAVHPILIVFPLGLLATAVIFDIVYLVAGGFSFSIVAYWMIAAGIIGGLVAAPFGLIDWMAIPSGTRAKRIGLMHAGSMVAALVLFAISWFFRTGDARPPETAAYVAGFIGVGVALFGGWLGGELVERLGVGVDDGANLNAPNSLASSTASVGKAVGTRM